MRWGALLMALALALTGGAACSALPAASADPRFAGATGSIPLDMSGPLPTARLNVGGRSLTAIFDSGAEASVVRLSAARMAGLPDEGSASAASPTGVPVSGFRTTLRNARLASVAFADAFAVAIDIPIPLPGVEAIISPSIFTGRLVRFDMARGVVDILVKNPANIPATPATGYIGGRHGVGVPAARLTLPNGHELVVDVDTGSTQDFNLPYELSSQLALAGPLLPGLRIRMIGSDHEVSRGRLVGRVRIGEVVLDNPEVNFVQGISRASIGSVLLRSMILLLDPEERRAWVLAAAGPQRPH